MTPSPVWFNDCDYCGTPLPPDNDTGYCNPICATAHRRRE